MKEQGARVPSSSPVYDKVYAYTILYYINESDAVLEITRKINSLNLVVS